MSLKGDSKIPYISRLTSDKIWFNSGKQNLTLSNVRGNILDQLNYTCSGVEFHTVNTEGELFFIDSENNVRKYSMDQKITTTFIKTTDILHLNFCVYTGPCSPEDYWLECVERSRVFSK